MAEFAHAFLLVFGQIGAGGIFSLSVPPFHGIERGFFKSTAAVYLGCAWIAVLGKGYLTIFAPHPPVVAWWAAYRRAAFGRGPEVLAWLAFACCCTLYVYTLWGDAFRLRARAYLLSLACAAAALATSAASYRLAPLASLETFVYPVSFLASSLLLGGVCTGMALGHWYLIDVGLPIDPFKRAFRFYLGTLLVHLGVIVLGAAALWLAGAEASAEALRRLWTDHKALFWLRLALGPLASLPLAYMIWRTLLIPQTMAATGLFYIATLAAVVGELLGRFILFRTSLPL